MRVKCTNAALARFRDVENGIYRTKRKEVQHSPGADLNLAGEVIREKEDDPGTFVVEVYEPIELDPVMEGDQVAYRRARVPRNIGEKLVNHPSGAFESLEDESQGEDE